MKKVKASMMNAIHDLPLLVARDEGFFRDQGLDVDIITKRAVESHATGHRPAKIVALGSAMSTFAIVADPKSGIYEPEQLKGKSIGVSPFNGSHFTTLKLLEGFLKREQITTTFAGTMRERIEALKRGEVAAISLMEPWISVAEKQGLRVLLDSHSTRSA